MPSSPEKRRAQYQALNAKRKALRLAARMGDEKAAAVVRGLDHRNSERKKRAETAWMRVSFNVTPAELRHIQAIAADRGVSVSAVIRSAAQASGLLPGKSST